MTIKGPLIHAKFIELNNRFITIIEIDGIQYRSHLPDPGRLKELLIPGADLMVRKAQPVQSVKLNIPLLWLSTKDN